MRWPRGTWPSGAASPAHRAGQRRGYGALLSRPPDRANPAAARRRGGRGARQRKHGEETGGNGFRSRLANRAHPGTARAGSANRDHRQISKTWRNSTSGNGRARAPAARDRLFPRRQRTKAGRVFCAGTGTTSWPNTRSGTWASPLVSRAMPWPARCPRRSRRVPAPWRKSKPNGARPPGKAVMKKRRQGYRIKSSGNSLSAHDPERSLLPRFDRPSVRGQGWNLLDLWQAQFEYHTLGGRADYLLRDQLGRVSRALEAKREDRDPLDLGTHARECPAHIG